MVCFSIFFILFWVLGFGFCFVVLFLDIEFVMLVLNIFLVSYYFFLFLGVLIRFEFILGFYLVILVYFVVF